MWHLGMNLNPADGHIMDYLTGWAGYDNIGSAASALTADYLEQKVWGHVEANFVAIVRHQVQSNSKTGSGSSAPPQSYYNK